ncbi:MAG: HDIG domain-containing protein, partial [Candidatus Hydrogenedentes bacterium]|nr:HDIG domain-containing protein [Candidatus Hydrogenedentota bacterium]
VLALGVLVRYTRAINGKPEDAARNLSLLLMIMVGTLALGRAACYFEPSGFVVPVAAGPILLAILTNVRVATLAAMLIPALVSVQFDYNWRLLVVGWAMSLAGALSIVKVRRRSDITAAALKATGVGLVTILAATLATDSLFDDLARYRVLLVVLNGCACLFMVPGLLSPLERLFGITTDIQLLEYSDLNNEVLSRLAIEIPATYAHSLIMGQLAEAACEAIGANGLLARVCAYYHDIGKMRRPEYFSENQSGVNIHDTLSPRLSARAIASHVTEGAVLAREHHLPKPIIDGILEHHGTSLISFFYQQALAQNKHGDVRNEDYRYPGPKPQTRETAILMICDGVESGVRSIKHPNEERVREFVDRIITSRAADRQFDECNLTLKELDKVKEVVTRFVLTTMHRRIAYPEKAPESQIANVIPLAGSKE